MTAVQSRNIAVVVGSATQPARCLPVAPVAAVRAQLVAFKAPFADVKTLSSSSVWSSLRRQRQRQRQQQWPALRSMAVTAAGSGHHIMALIWDCDGVIVEVRGNNMRSAGVTDTWGTLHDHHSSYHAYHTLLIHAPSMPLVPLPLMSCFSLQSEEIHRQAYNAAFQHFDVRCPGQQGPVDWSVAFYDDLQNRQDAGGWLSPASWHQTGGAALTPSWAGGQR